MKNITLEELLEAGCHFGHQVSRQNAKARDYIFEARDKIHIIDLEKTKEGLEEAGKFVHDLAKRGGTILVLGTKKQADAILRDEKKRLGESDGVYFVTKRWIGGTLTNSAEVAKNYKKLKDITARLQNDFEKAKYTKKEIGDWEKEKQKLEAFYGGIADINGVPDAVFIIDTHHERVAAAEASKSGVKTVGITDTNADPTIIDYPIPANDDAVGSLKLIIGYILDAWAEGRKAKEVGDAKAREEKEQETKNAEAAASDAVKKEEKKVETSDVSKEEKVIKTEEKPVKKATKKAAPEKKKEETK